MTSNLKRGCCSAERQRATRPGTWSAPPRVVSVLPVQPGHGRDALLGGPAAGTRRASRCCSGASSGGQYTGAPRSCQPPFRRWGAWPREGLRRSDRRRRYGWLLPLGPAQAARSHPPPRSIGSPRWRLDERQVDPDRDGGTSPEEAAQSAPPCRPTRSCLDLRGRFCICLDTNSDRSPRQQPEGCGSAGCRTRCGRGPKRILGVALPVERRRARGSCGDRLDRPRPPYGTGR